MHGWKKHNGTVIVNVKLTSPSSWKIKLRKKKLNKVIEKLLDIINESKYIQKLYIVEADQPIKHT